uniref:Thioredoxin-like 4, chloroplastic n=1 Tax=Anthurium amnicola TaxID=1678845 RepID=A0A1D1XW99_9ARAE
MPNPSHLSCGASSSAKLQIGTNDTGPVNRLPMLPHAISKNYIRSLLTKTGFPHTVRNLKLKKRITSHMITSAENNCVPAGIEEKLSLIDEDDENCPVDCVREFETDEDLLKILAKAKKTASLVVVDFYRTSCGSCKYIEQGFMKLCKGSGDEEAAVIFLKHNVMDEYDEQTEVAERLRIKSVPLFHFYKDGVLLEAFPTRDKERILAAIRKYT